MFLCSMCHRHVRDRVCPFCGAETAVALAGPRVFRIGMKRSALLLASAVAAAVNTGCGGAVEPGASDAGAARPIPHENEDSGTTDSATTMDAPEETATPDTGDVRDTGSPCDPDVMAAATDYGIPPPPPCRDRD